MDQTEARDTLRELRSAHAEGLRAFDQNVLRRDSRTVRRWVQGQSPIPKAVLEYLYSQVQK